MKPITKNIFSYTILLSFVTTFTSCTQKPWPEDVLSQIQQSGVLSDECKIVNLLSNTSEYDYINCVIEAYRSSYPDYGEFIQVANNNPQQIKQLRIPCIKYYAGNDINNVWKLIENNDGVKNLKNKLPSYYYLQYKELMMSKIRAEYVNIENFIDVLTNNESSVSTFISILDQQCGEIINVKISQESEKLQKVELSTADDPLNSSPKTSTNNTDSENVYEFTITAYPVGKNGNGAQQIILSIGSSVGLTQYYWARFANNTKSKQYFVSKNPKYNTSGIDDTNYESDLSNYYYIFTANDGTVWGFTLE